MRAVLILVFILLCSLFQAQSTSHLRLSTRYLNHYSLSDTPPECPNTKESDTTSSFYDWILNYAYPYASCSDSSLSGLINRAVRSTLDYTGKPERVRKVHWNCPADKPGQEVMNYRLCIKNEQFLSFTLFKDTEPAGFGNGFAHVAWPFTFDLKKKKILVLNDILKAEADSTLSKRVWESIKTSGANLEGLTEEESSQTSTAGFSVMHFYFALTRHSLRIYVPLNYGGKSSYEDFEFKLSDLESLLSDARLLAFVKAGKK